MSAYPHRHRTFWALTTFSVYSLCTFVSKSTEYTQVNPSNYHSFNAKFKNKILDSDNIYAKNSEISFRNKDSVTSVSKKIVRLSNLSRRKKRKCGAKKYSATHKLLFSAELTNVAQRYAEDMARNQSLSHTGVDGSDIKARVEPTGLIWRALGENIANGYTSAKEVHKAWLDSPSHCKNIMNPAFKRAGVGKYGDYWVVIFSG